MKGTAEKGVKSVENQEKSNKNQQIQDVGASNHTPMAHEYLRRKHLVMPFGERGIACCAHWLCVPKSKMQQENVQAVTHWVLSWAKRRSPAKVADSVAAA